MLAYMPQPVPSFNLHTPKSMGDSTMSLTILPSAPSAQAIPALGPSPSKRPKLSLNTSNVNPVYGKGSTSLRLETLSATSPTARNTFRNTQSPKSPRLRRPAWGLLTTSVQSPPTPTLTPSRIELPDSVPTTPVDSTSSSAASATSVSTVQSFSTEPPYKLPFNTKSILINGPLQRAKIRRFSFSESQPMFPLPRKVGFRDVLEEEIATTKYTMRHSDILSPAAEIATLELSSPKEAVRKDASDYQNEGAALIAEQEGAVPSVACNGEEAQEDPEESQAVPVTPVAGRNKKDRAWRWTLGPITPAQDSEQRS